MTAILRVKELRQEIYRLHHDSSRNSVASTLPRSIFDETVATLLGSDQQLNFLAAINEIEPVETDWVRALTSHAYHRLVGPLLQQRQALLHQLTDQILIMWDAVQEFCRWLAGILAAARRRGDEELAGLIWRRVDLPAALTLSLPNWREDLVLTGEIGAVWFSSLDQQWVSIGMTTGVETVEANLADTALTHLLLSAAERPDPVAGVRLRRITFTPGRVEQTCSADELRGWQEKLIRLAGDLAGVAGPAVAGDQSTARKDLPPDTAETGRHLIAILRDLEMQPRTDAPAITAPAFIRFPFAVTGLRNTRALDRVSREIQNHLNLATPPLLAQEGDRLLIDLPRPDRREISYDEIRDKLPAGKPDVGSALAPLGVDLCGHLRLIDFSRPEDAHLLLAGRPGSGKTEWIRTAIAGLIHANRPETLQLTLFDSENRIFSSMRESAFLHAPLIDSPPDAIAALASLVSEMEQRYILMRELGTDSLSAIALRSNRPVPRIFFICDEYTDLFGHDREKRRMVERQITQLGQRSRMAGIHLIIATRHPGRETIRGVLDSNIPARIGLRMTSAIESKIVLSQAGAEKLLGRGDLFFRDISGLIRLQAARLDAANLPQ